MQDNIPISVSKTLWKLKEDVPAQISSMKSKRGAYSQHLVEQETKEEEKTDLIAGSNRLKGSQNQQRNILENFSYSPY